MSMLGEVVGFAFLVLTPCPAAQAKPTDDVSFQEKRLAVVPETFQRGPDIVFSRDGRTVAYTASKGGKAFVFVGDKKGEGFDAVSYVAFTPDGTSVCYIATRGGKQFLVLGDKKGEEFDRVYLNPQRFDSPILLTRDGKAPVYVAEKDGKQLVVVGEKRGESFDRIVGLALCSDGKTPLYFGQRGGKFDARGNLVGPVSFVLVVGDKKEQGQDFDKIYGETLSPGGHTGAYIGFKGDPTSPIGKYCVVVGGKKGEEFNSIFPATPWLSFSPDGKTVAYCGLSDRTFYVVLGNQKFKDARLPLFSPDGTTLAFERNGKIEVAVSPDGGRTFAAPVAAAQQTWPGYGGVYNLTFSPDGKTWAYSTLKAEDAAGQNASCVVVGDQKGEDFEEVSRPVFSTDNKTVAYTGTNGRQKTPGDMKTFVVVGGKKGEMLNAHGNWPLTVMPRFSPDGKTVVYVAMKAVEGTMGKYVVVGEVWGEKFDGIDGRSLVFSPDGKTVAYVAYEGTPSERRFYVIVGNKRIEEFDGIGTAVIGGLRFSADGQKVAFGALKGRELWWKVVDPKSPDVRKEPAKKSPKTKPAPAPAPTEKIAEAVQGLPANERNAWASLKAICSAEADFRANDRDENRIQDFWTGDVAGLYSMTGSSLDKPMKLVDLSIALADAAPLEAGSAGGKYVAITKFGTRAPKSGYYFRTFKTDNSADSPEIYQQETEGQIEGQPKMGKVHHISKFAFCAYPAEYGKTGRKTYIINEHNTVFGKDTQGQAVTEWPSDQDLRKWQKLD